MKDDDKVEEKDEGNDEDTGNDEPVEEDKDTTDDEDEKEASKDPTCKYKITIDNDNRRVTRSNKNQATPHCSLITNTKKIIIVISITYSIVN